MLKIGYFSDIALGYSGVFPHYISHLKNITPKNYSIELLASGKMYFQHLPGETHLIDYPALRWQAPGNTYRYGPVDRAGWEHYFIHFSGERGRRLYEQGFSRLAEKCFIPVKRVDHYRNLFRTIHHILQHQGLDKDRAAFHLEEVLVSAMEDVVRPKGFNKYLDEIKTICDNMRYQMQDDFDLKAIAASMHVSYSHFRKLFIEYAGVPPHQYILRNRMNAAAERLQLTDMPIKEIAFELNLGNPVQFSKAFRKMHAMPPAAYRRKSSLCKYSLNPILQ
ncbi:MAG: AraC family transcriptional regulator [Victivallales bacterium]